MDGMEKITDLSEDTEQKVREKINDLRISLKECDSYLNRYLEADVVFVKMGGAMLIMARSLEDAYKELEKL